MKLDEIPEYNPDMADMPVYSPVETLAMPAYEPTKELDPLPKESAVPTDDGTDTTFRELEWLHWLDKEDKKNAEHRKTTKLKVFPRLPDNKNAAKVLVAAEDSLRKRKQALDEVKTYEARLREQMKHIPKEDQDIIVEEKLKEYVGNTMSFGGYGDMFKRLWGDFKETTSPRDEYKALTGAKEYISPLQAIESIVSQPLSPSKWDWKVKNPREKLERILNSPLVYGDGHVNLEAVFHSDMPREWQNQFMAYEAAKQTGLPTELWNDIVEGRYGSLPSKEGGTSALKRTAQMLDSVVLNSYSNTLGGVNSKIDMLKRIKPPYTIYTKIDDEGVRVFDMPGTTADGMATDAQEGDPNSPQTQQRLWADFVGYAASMVQDESISNLADVMSAVTETVAGVFVPPLGGAMAARRAGKIANAARRSGKASRVEKIVNATKSLSNALPQGAGITYRALQGDFPIITTISRMTPAGKRMGLEFIKNNPRMAGIANAADRVITIAATHAAMGYAGAGEKSKEQAAIGAALMSVPMNIPLAVKNSFQYNVLLKYPKAYKEIARTDDPKKLSAFSRGLVDRSGMKWEQIKADQELFERNTQLVLDTALHLEQGLIDDAHVPEVVNLIATNPDWRKYADAASGATTEGLGVGGRFNKIVVEELIEQLSAAIKAAPEVKFAASVNAAAVGKLGVQRLKKKINQIPNDIWSDEARLFEYLDKDPNTKPYAVEIKNRLEDRGFGRDLAYYRMASQMLQVGLIIKGGKQAGKEGLQLLREFYNILANPGPEVTRLKKLEDFQKHSSTVTGFVKVADDSELGYHFEISREKLPKISPQATVKGIMDNPLRIEEVLTVTKDVLGEYSELSKTSRGSGKPRLQRGVDERVKLLTKKERDFLLDTSLDADQLNAEVKVQRLRIQESIQRQVEAITSAIGVAKTHGLTDSDVNLIVRGLRKPGEEGAAILKELKRKYPKDLLKASSKIVTLAKRHAVALDKHARVSQAYADAVDFADSRGNVFIEKAKQFSPDEKYWNSLGLPPIKELSEHPYWQAVSNKLAYDMVKGIEDTGVPTVNVETMKMLRALEVPAFVRELASGFAPEEVRSVTEQAKLLGRAIHRQTNVSRVMRDKIKRIEEELAGISDSKLKRSAAIAWMRQIREAYKGIYSLKAFVRKYEDLLYEVSDKITQGVELSSADKKLLYTLTKSSPMATYRMRAPEIESGIDSSWVVSLAQEAQMVYPAIEKAGVEAFNIFLRKAVEDNPNITDVQAAILAGRFLGVTEDAKQSGFLQAAVLAARYFRRSEDDLDRFSLYPLREILSNQDNLSAFLSRETAMGVDRVLSKYGNALSDSKMFFQREIADGYLNDLDKIPGYLVTDYGTNLTQLLRRFAGYGENYEWPMLDGRTTEFGAILRRNVIDGEDLDKIFESLEADAMKLSDTDRGGPRKLRFQLTHRDARLENLRRWKSSIQYYWKPGMDDPKIWEIAFEVQRVTQEWDRKAVEVYNALTDDLNKLWGTNYSKIEYQPYRLEGHMRHELDKQSAELGANALQTIGIHSTPMGGAYDRLMSTSLLGRSIESSREGQLHKIRNLGVHDVDDIRNNFLFSKELLITHGYTRDALVELRDLGIRLKDGGYTRYAESVARTALRHYAMIAPEGLRRLAVDLIDSGKIPVVSDSLSTIRVLGAMINPFQMLSTIRKTFIDNPIDWIIMGLGSSPHTLYRLPLDSMKFVLQYPIRIFVPNFSISNPSGMLNALGAYRHLTPEASKAVERYVKSTRKVKKSKADRQQTMINWNTKPVYRTAYWWGGRIATDFMSEPISIGLKDNSESLVRGIVIDHATNAYTDAVLSAQKSRGRSASERIQEVRKILAWNLKATGIAADISEQAVTLVRDVDANAPYRGLGGYLFQVDANGVSRFDPNNIPPLIVALDRILPGSATFFNSIYNMTYRTFKLASNALSGKQAESAFVALLGVAAWGGLSYMFKSLQQMNDDGTEGIGRNKWLIRHDPLQMFHSFREATTEKVRSPAIRVGSMDQRFWYEFVYRIKELATGMDIRDYHEDREYDSKQKNQGHLLALFKLMESSTPLTVLSDFLGSPVAVGWHYLAMDPEHVKEKIMKEIQNDPVIQNQFARDKDFEQKFTEQQMAMVDLLSGFLGMVMPIGSEKINPITDPKWERAQLAFRMALGKLGIGADNEMLWAFATANRNEVETLLELYRGMEQSGAAPFPEKSPGSEGTEFLPIDMD
jgi:hypothetical protein